MERLLIIRPERSPGAQRLGHVGQTERPAVFRVREEERQLPPGAVLRAVQLHRAAEAVGIGAYQRPLRAVNLQARLPPIMNVEGGEQGAHRPAGKLQQAGHMGGDMDADGFAAVRLAGNQPFGKGGAGHSRNRGHAAEQVDQGRQVIRPHIEKRAAAPLVVKIGVGMPALMAAADHEGRRPHRLPDIAAVNQAAAGLQPGP